MRARARMADESGKRKAESRRGWEAEGRALKASVAHGIFRNLVVVTQGPGVKGQGSGVSIDALKCIKMHNVHYGCRP